MDRHTYDGHGGHSPECFPCKVAALKETYTLRWLRTRDDVAKEVYKQIVDDLKKLCEEAE